MKRILVTGASGLLGLNFCNFFCGKYEAVGLAHQTKLHAVPFRVLYRDLMTENAAELLDEIKPDTVLHCAAVADIDKCEKDPETAKAVNSLLPGKLAVEARRRGIKFIHISTDAVFDGENCGENGYREDDPTNPISCYAETKLNGERYVLDADPDALVARVNFFGWSPTGKRSLAEFFYNNLSAGNEVRGFRDVYFSTLYVHHLADILDEMITAGAKGIYHVFSADHQSKYEFGRSIAEKFGFSPDLVIPVSWKDGGLTARRSPNLIMNTEKLHRLLGHDLPTQKMNLDHFYQDTKAGLRDRIREYAFPEETEA